MIYRIFVCIWVSFLVESIAAASGPGAFTILTPDGPGNDDTPTVTTSGSSGAVTWNFIIGNDANCDTNSGSYTGPNTTYTPAALSDGDYWVCSTAVDVHDDVTFATNNKLPFEVDTEDPGDFSVTAPADGTATNDTTPTITWTASSGSFEYHAILYTNSACTTVKTSYNGSAASWTTTSLTDGDYYLIILAHDEAGNGKYITNSCSLTFEVDIVNPGAFSFTAPADGSAIKRPSARCAGSDESNDSLSNLYRNRTPQAMHPAANLIQSDQFPYLPRRPVPTGCGEQYRGLCPFHLRYN